MAKCLSDFEDKSLKCLSSIFSSGDPQGFDGSAMACGWSSIKKEVAGTSINSESVIAESLIAECLLYGAPPLLCHAVVIYGSHIDPFYKEFSFFWRPVVQRLQQFFCRCRPEFF